ncbi:hypothetical protein [Aureibacillus halotolerans]|uniref:Uncharacterized protein n=1 Tax=Aureibacillus halotolerans TaxID=1508390 RepID=A0A4R6TQ45_9BACI|nr:hypothetical protein [Aureibacillus halotolerans]TDQ34619.1 hypothetical protein EV213_12437 [Aureibacillus halotolerans]
MAIKKIQHEQVDERKQKKMKKASLFKPFGDGIFLNKKLTIRKGELQ